MGKATLARQKAIGTIGGGRVRQLEDAGLTILFTEEYEKLTARVAELEKANKLLKDIAADTTQTSMVAAQILKEAMGTR